MLFEELDQQKNNEVGHEGEKCIASIEKHTQQPIVASIPIPAIHAAPPIVHSAPPAVQPENVQRWSRLNERENMLVYSRRPRQGVKQEQQVHGKKLMQGEHQEDNIDEMKYIT